MGGHSRSAHHNNDEIITFSSEGKLRKFIASRLALHTTLDEVHQVKRNGTNRSSYLQKEMAVTGNVNVPDTSK